MGHFSEKYKIIYVEDNPTDFDMVKAILDEENVLDWMICVENKADFIEAISRNEHNLILTEYSLPVFHGFEVINTTHEYCPDIPVIMVTGSQPDEIAIEAIKKGAWDYVLKQNIYRLLPSIRGVMDKKRILDENISAQIALMESEENYRSLAENSPYGIIVHSDGKLRYYNKTALDIFGLTDNLNFIGHDVMKFIHPGNSETVKSRIAKLYKGESLVDFLEEVFLYPDGRELFVEVSSAAIMFNGIPAAQVIFRDISERKRMEQQLIEAKEKAEEADRLKTSFLENLSHEIRTPLNGIIGFTNLLKFKEVNEKDREKYLQVIEDSGLHLLNIINDLIDISKIEAGQVDIHKEKINLNHMLEELFIFFNDSTRYQQLSIILRLNKALPDDDSFLITDPLRLRQILMNLLGNAFKYTQMGNIDFGYELENDGSIRFFVKDTGIGIPENAYNIIFNRFRQVDESKTRKYGGNGLGLSICKGLVQAMKGKIWFNSREGYGTEFYFSLPDKFEFIPLRTEKITTHDNNQVYDLSKYTILVAEDEESNYILIEHLLRPSGIGVVHVKDGKEAMDLLKKRKDFNLALFDIKMPEVDGLELAEWIVSQGINIPLIAQTAYAMPGDKEKCLAAGFSDYIVKPIRAELLLKIVNSYLKNH
jgi:PAS domain S-box-containing protein